MINWMDQAMAATKLWTDFATKMMTATLSVAPTATPPEATRQLRSGALDALSEMYDQMVRSPQGLEMMRQWMDSLMTLRKEYNDALTQARHYTQGVASEDIDEVMLTVRHFERRVLERLDDLAERVEGIARRLDGLEDEARTAKGSNGHAAPRQPAGRAARRTKTTREARNLG